MTLYLTNFGQFDEFTIDFESRTWPNGAGKTTLVNAYLFALTGRCLTGFQPRRVDAPDDETTGVTVEGWPAPTIEVRRTLSPKGSTCLYLNGDMATQTEFVDILAQRFGIPIDLVVACADANLLTDPALTAEQLRRLLVRASLVENDEATSLRRERDALRKARKTAEQYALTTVAVPQRTVEPLTEAETNYMARAGEHVATLNRIGPTLPTVCPTCGKQYTAAETDAVRRERDAAAKAYQGMRAEVERITERLKAYSAETAAIEEAEAIISRASGARRRVQEIDTEIAALEEQIRAADAAAVRPALPDDVQIITETTAKTTGRTSSTCTLTYKGVPLKSVNRAKRVEICVRILETARVMTDTVDKIPIIIDNAESVQGLDDVRNVIRFTVGE